MYGPLTHGTINQRLFYGAAIVVLIMILMPQTAYAAGSAMPWEGPLTSILQSIEGPVAKIFGTIAIIMTGIGLAFGDAGGGMRNLIKIVFGLSIAFTATSFFPSFFSFTGGAVI
ncbi:TrbC/VirB2 family protein [Litorimonas haliclonae]|uniref:TrbC/VirB2 family protein n=1 Tax=Litorimonas haliclonae TaxID=2081977 RepID=UPI0039F0EF71